MFASCVTLKIVPQHFDAFWSMVTTQAETSLSLEEGCRQFDVLHDETRPFEVFLYELYDDADAFEAHLASMHFLTFNSAVTRMISERRESIYRSKWDHSEYTSDSICIHSSTIS